MALVLPACSDDVGRGPKANNTSVNNTNTNNDNDVGPGDDTTAIEDIAKSDVCVGPGCEVVDECNPNVEVCPCRAGQLKLCSSLGDPLSFSPQSACRAGTQRCIKGEWEAQCHGELAPDDGICEVDVDLLDCAGFIDQFGECIEGPRGDPADANVLCTEGSAGSVGGPCSCEIPEDGDPETLRRGQPCYSAHIDTLGVGICRAGVRDCQIDGSWGACIGEVTPQAEVCGDGIDNNCNAVIDDGCPGCPPGMDTCDDLNNGIITVPCPNGNTRNACGGCTAVTDEICGDGLDNNCNGLVDEGCPCTGSTQRCYLGPAEAAGVGECKWGIQSCLGEAWGPCTGPNGTGQPMLPTQELCGPDGTGNGKDNSCNGIIDDGCGCTAGATRSCGSNVGQCRSGTQTCAGGLWGSCQNAIGPATEVCDGTDNNCNGINDEGLLNACGTCGNSCYVREADPANSGILDEGSQLIDADAADNPTGRAGLTLAKQTFFPPYLWAANSVHGTVSKFNTETSTEEGRYFVGASQHSRSAEDAYFGTNPSRTAVDLDGNMWVIGRGDGRVTKVLWDSTSCPGNTTSMPTAVGPTQINTPNDLLRDECVVYSGFPAATSSPAQSCNQHSDCATGVCSTGCANATCISGCHPSSALCSPGVCVQRSNGRGVAVAPDGKIWLGYSDRNAGLSLGAIVSIDPHTYEVGELKPSTNVPLYSPDANGVQQPVLNANGSAVRENAGSIYGLVGDSRGFIYASGLWESRGLFRYDTAKGEWDAYYTGFNCEVYGIAVDGRNRIWMGCSDAGWGPAHTGVAGGIAVFDPATNKVTRFFVPNEFQTRLPTWNETSPVVTSCLTSSNCARRFQTTAVAVEPATGNVWATVRSIGYLLRLELNELDLAQSEWTYIPVLRDAQNALLGGLGLGSAPDMRGIGFDRLGYAWHLGMSSEYVFKVDPVTNARVEVVKLGVGGHYTYSDFTGSTAFSFTAPRGYWRYYFDTGYPNAQLDGITWEGYSPDGTTIGVRIRPLDSNNNPSGPWRPAEVNGVADYFVYPRGVLSEYIDLHASGGPMTGRTFEVEIRMTSSDAAVRPILHDLSLQWQRP
ncbi:MAG: hypothetical protein H0U74_13950 [Bradymonadaceae bacterium]|nr:hypothetical protein [Lujinxingiaceae bacterium]